MKSFSFTVFCVFALFCSTNNDVRADVMLGIVNDFQSGTEEGWMHTVPNTFSPVNVPDAGPAGVGDNALQISSSGIGGAGTRYLAFNSALDWIGNYTAAGVTGIQFQVNNTGAADLNLRFALNGSGGWFVTAPMVVSSGSGWLGPQSFDLTASALLAVEGTDVNATLADVTEVQIMSALDLPTLGVGGRPRGDSFAGEALFDNFTAIPEPSTLAMLVSLAGMVALRSRRRR